MNRNFNVFNKSLKLNFNLIKREYGIRNYKIYENLKNYSLEFTLIPFKIHLKNKKNDIPLGRWNTINMNNEEKLNIASVQSGVHCGPCGTEKINIKKSNNHYKYQ